MIILPCEEALKPFGMTLNEIIKLDKEQDELDAKMREDYLRSINFDANKFTKKILVANSSIKVGDVNG